MKNFLSNFVTMLLLAVTSVSAQAALVDFENTGLYEGQTVTSQIAGLTITGAIVALPGEPGYAFGSVAGTDKVLPSYSSNFNGYFITDLVVGTDPNSPYLPGTIGILFDNPVSNLSFYAADIEGEEILTAQIFDNTGSLMQTLTINGQDPQTGDGMVIMTQFDAANISSLTIYVSPSSNGLSGWGVDNLSFTPAPVPVPATLWLFGSGLAGLVGLRRKKYSNNKAGQ